MKKQIISISILALGFIAGATALSALAQTSGTWTAPAAAPPNGNVPAPINVGSLGQAKSGLLALANFVFNPTGVVGSVTPGQVLTAVDNAGTVGWRSAGTDSGIPSNIVVINNTGTWTVPAGVTRIRVRAWGGGAGGGKGGENNGIANGGGGGAYSESVLSVVPGSSHVIQVGIGGIAGSCNIIACAGGSGSLSGFDTTVQAGGGYGDGTGGTAIAGELTRNGGNGAPGIGGLGAYGGGLSGDFPAGGGKGTGQGTAGNGAGGQVVIDY